MNGSSVIDIILAIFTTAFAMYFIYKIIDIFGGTTEYSYKQPECVTCKKKTMEMKEKTGESSGTAFCTNKKCRSYGIERNIKINFTGEKFYSLSEERKLRRKGEWHE